MKKSNRRWVALFVSGVVGVLLSSNMASRGGGFESVIAWLAMIIGGIASLVVLAGSVSKKSGSSKSRIREETTVDNDIRSLGREDQEEANEITHESTQDHHVDDELREEQQTVISEDTSDKRILEYLTALRNEFYKIKRLMRNPSASEPRMKKFTLRMRQDMQNLKTSIEGSKAHVEQEGHHLDDARKTIHDESDHERKILKMKMKQLAGLKEAVHDLHENGIVRRFMSDETHENRDLTNMTSLQDEIDSTIRKIKEQNQKIIEKRDAQGELFRVLGDELSQHTGSNGQIALKHEFKAFSDFVNNMHRLEKEIDHLTEQKKRESDYIFNYEQRVNMLKSDFANWAHREAGDARRSEGGQRAGELGEIVSNLR